MHVTTFQTVVLEKALESPLDSQDIKSVNPKGSQLWIFIGRTDAEGSSVVWISDVKSPLTGRDLDAAKDWGQEENGAEEDEMVREHHWLNEHESEQTPGDSGGQGSLASYSSRGHKQSGVT